MALRCDGRDQAHAMTSAACYDNGCFAFLAPATPGMMIRADMSRVTKIDVCTLALSHFLDLRIFRLQPFLDQRLVAFHRPVQRLLRCDTELGQQAPNRVCRQPDAVFVLD